MGEGMSGTEIFWIGAAVIGIAVAAKLFWQMSRDQFRFYRRWCGGHWERWYLDIPVGGHYWFREAYCGRMQGSPSSRPGLGRGTPRCEDWPIMDHPWLVLIGGRHWAYGRYLLVHKWHVARTAWRMGLPWRVKLVSILHDASKFRPSEWGPYARHFYLADGTPRSKKGVDGFLDHPKNDRAFNRAWLRHYQRNRHHPQHWVTVTRFDCPCNMAMMYSYRPRVDVLLGDDKVTCLSCGYVGTMAEVRYIVDEMPEPYLSEMLIDWIGAGMAQGNPDTLGWYASRGVRYIYGSRTRAAVERRLGYPDRLPDFEHPRAGIMECAE